MSGIGGSSSLYTLTNISSSLCTPTDEQKQQRHHPQKKMEKKRHLLIFQQVLNKTTASKKDKRLVSKYQEQVKAERFGIAILQAVVAQAWVDSEVGSFPHLPVGASEKNRFHSLSTIEGSRGQDLETPLLSSQVINQNTHYITIQGGVKKGGLDCGENILMKDMNLD